MGENDKIPPPPSGQIVMPKVIPPPPSGEVVMPVQKKSEVEPTPEEKGVQSTNGSATVSSQGGEQPQGSGESESLWDIAKRYAGAALEKITSGHGLFGTETEVKNAQKLAEQRKETIQQSVIKNKKEKQLIDKSFVRNNVVNEIVKNNNISQENSKDPNIQQLQALYNQLDEVRSGRGVAGADEQTILDRIAEISNKKIEPQQIGVDQFGQPIIKKLPYKNYSDMYDATFKAATKVNDGKAILPELDKQISEGANELRAKKGFKFTGKDANGNDIYEMNPMESFVNGATNTMQSMSIGLHNLTGNKEYALDQMKRKYFEDNVLYPKTTGEGVYGTIAKGTEMLGGVAPLMAAAPMGGIGALAMNTLLFGAQDYGGKLYEKYLEKKNENPDISDEEALKEAEGTAEFAGVKGMILGGTMPLQGALGRKMFLNEAERGAFKSFIAEQGVMIPSFGASTAIQNWYEGKPIEDNVGRSMVDAFIIGGMTHALHALPTMPQKIKTTFENTLAKNYNNLATVFDAGVRDGSIDYATVQRIQERAKGYDVVGKDAPEKAVDKGIELNSIANEIAERKETNPLADVTDLEQKAEEVNKQIHELKGTALTEKESKELDNLNGKEELTPTEKRKKKHYEKRIETAKQAEEAAKEETIKRQQEEKTPPIIVPKITVDVEFESPYYQSLKKLGYSDNQISGLTIEQQQQIVDNKIQAPVTDIKEQVVKTDSRKEAARQEKIAEAQRKLDEEVAAEEQEVQPKQEGGGGEATGGGVLEKTQEVEHDKYEKIKSELPKSEYTTEDDFKNDLENGEWALLTAENPNDTSLSPEENAKRNEQAEQWLIKKGYKPQKVAGKYNRAENSFYVKSMTKADAIAFANIFGQENVATDKGLYYQDGSFEARIKGGESYGASDNYVSAINVNGKPIEFSVEFSKDKTKPTKNEKQVSGNRLFSKPLEVAKTIADRYAEKLGFKRSGFEKITKANFDKERAKRIAKAFDDMQNNPNDQEVKAAYEAMAKETIDQYKEIMKDGYRVEVNNDEPYSSSEEMIEDLRDNKRMKIFSTESGFGDEAITEQQRKENPLLRDSGFKDANGVPLLVNDIFRFVHDFFGHSELGNSFGELGEENAWNVHARMYSPLARRAMTTETRGQNSWVNSSGINKEAFEIRDKARKLREVGEDEAADVLVKEVYDRMKFAEQKVGLLPEEFSKTDDELLGKKEASKKTQKAEPTEETAIFAEYNNARSDVARDKAINKLPEGIRKNALDIVKNFEDYLGRFKKLKEEGKIEFETDC